MTQKNAASLFKAIQQDKVLKEKLAVASNPETFVKLAKEQGYQFTPEELQAAIDQLSEEDLAVLVNPGVAPRHHIFQR
jgi:predicted ribosomally synthesized peptide with nif11-like leader